MRLCQNVVVDGFDLSQNAAVDARQRPQSRLAIPADQVLQADSLFIKLPRPIRLELHHPDEFGTCNGAAQTLFGAAETCEIFLREVNTTHPKVFPDVAQNVCQL